MADSVVAGLQGWTQQWVEVRPIAGYWQPVAEGVWPALGGGRLVLTPAAGFGEGLLPAGPAHQES